MLLIEMIPALCAAALVQAHSQHYTVSTCVQQNGTIHVDNPRVSSTYWVQDSTCTFLLDRSAMPIDEIVVTRASVNVTAGTLTLQNGTVRRENLLVQGKGEPFAILPLYTTIQGLTNITTESVTVRVDGKAMVSFGKAEDPGLLLAGIVMDAHEARNWTYGASVYLTLIHFGMFLLTLAMALGGQYTVSSSCLRCSCCWARILEQRYNKTKQIFTNAQGVNMANTFLVLDLWIVISVVMDMLIWTVWVWTRIESTGGTWFWRVSVARVLFYAYLTYIVWEVPAVHLGTWAPYGSDSFRRWAVPAVTGGVPTFYLAYFLYEGQDALSDAFAFYIGIPLIIGLLCVVLPWTVGKGALFTAFVCAGQLILVTCAGIALNMGLGALAPLCMLFAFHKRLYTKASQLDLLGKRKAQEPVQTRHLKNTLWITVAVAVLLLLQRVGD